MQDQQAASNDSARLDEPQRAYRILIADLVGLRFDAEGLPDPSEVKAHIEARGGVFHDGGYQRETLPPGIHFFYTPDLSAEVEIIAQTADGRYDALIAAATFIPKQAIFPLGGVRIGAGTGNMGSASWGGGDGEGGAAPLMNTPGINSRATAQMVMKAIMKVMPDLPVDLLHQRVAAGDFDTGRDLKSYPTAKLEGRRMAVLGYGNIGREVAKLGRAFGMDVVIYARAKHRQWIEAEGFDYAETPVDAAQGADVLSVHVGLGRFDVATHIHANAGIVGEAVLSAMNRGAIVVNYDRGEVVDVSALDRAIASGQVRHAAIDADLFKNATSGALNGPMQPYLKLAERHPGKLELLPHAAADTDHPSRVAGACQAVDQIIDAIRYRRVTNLKGDLPENYVDAGAKVPPGIGRVTTAVLAAAAVDPRFAELHDISREIADTLEAIVEAVDEGMTHQPADGDVAALTHLLLRQRRLIEALGLDGPAGG
ncbi:acetohydroxy acid isomeroreductase, catalytic domain protein (plasmid) [Sinorhizobium sp. RAC02]|nr:acetohydroxy acid isomeroreductase, catalytic domain protein [Sinorhizobium sp. RAC02]